MSVFDQLRSVGRFARDASRTAAEAAMQNPNVRRRVEEARTAYEEMRGVVEERLEALERDLLNWINQAQAQAQRAQRQLDRARAADVYYKTLGISAGADLDAVKAAWRAKMREHHPDRFAHDPDAEARAHAHAQEINRAYQELTALLTGRESRRAS
ncbi:MAG: J domain-containing protein [Myxococcales bacterium]|nr:J domain-containing protein [Myxococcales bacterium]